jgi:hypothetical protein
MKLTDFEIMEEFGMLLSSIYLEGRITANEAERLAFYALYNNSCSTTNCYDIDENLHPVDYSSISNKSATSTLNE